MKNVNLLLSSLHSHAVAMVENTGLTGYVDTHKNECLFAAMKEIAYLNPAPLLKDIQDDLGELYKLCLLTEHLEEVGETEDAAGFSNNQNDLAAQIVKKWPEMNRILQLEGAVKEMSKGTKGMDPDDRKMFAGELEDLLEKYDLMGEEAFCKLFVAA